MLDERGHLNRVISFLNYVYVFRDYGISRITAYADQSEFSATNLFVSSGRIYEGTVTDCGGGIMFLASDGVYKFDGLSTHKALPWLCPIIKDSPQASGAYFDGKYYLALNLECACAQECGAGSNSILVYDLKSGEYSILQDFPALKLRALDDALYVISADGRLGKIKKCGSSFGVPTQKIFDSGLYDYGTPALKYFRSITFESNAELVLTLYTEQKEKLVKVTPRKGVCTVRIGLRGRKFGFRIRCFKAGVRVARPYIKYGVSG
jgi:hypothetical protein